MSWEPLHDGDPFPADAAGVRTYGEAVHGTGELIVDQVSLLRRLADRRSWTTESADAFREKAEELADAISKAKDRYLETGSALTTLADQLDEHERQAEIRRSEAEALAPVAGRDPVEAEPAPDGGPGELTAAQRDSNRARSAAVSRLGQLQREFDRIVADAEADAEHARSVIERSSEDDVTDGFWEKHAGWIRTAAGVIAAVAAIVLLTVATGGLIWVVAMVIAVAAGFVALAMSVGRFYTGNGPWYDIAFDLVGVLTLGTGGFALSALKAGLPALRGTYATFSGSRAGAAALEAARGPLDLAVRFSASRFPMVAALGRRNLVDIHHAAALAEDAARTAATTAPTLTRVHRFVLGGREAAEHISHTREIRRGLTATDSVPVPVPLLRAAGRLSFWEHLATGSLTLGSLNQGAALTTGVITEPTSVDNGVGAVQLVVDVIGRSQ